MNVGDEARRGEELVRRRTAQVQAIANTDPETAASMVREFTEQVVQTNVFPFSAYTPAAIVEWWKREHATEPRRW